MKKVTLKFKNGEILTGVIVAKTLSCYIVRSNNLHFIVNRFNLLNDPSDHSDGLDS